MPLDESHCAVTYKILVLGDYSVGKSALLKNLVGSPFNHSMLPTVGVDFVRKIVEVDGALVQLLIWDSAGQERFRSITKQQYRGVHGLLLVYDMTNMETFETLKYWVNSIQEEISAPSGQYEPIPFVICGNKSDLASERTVSIVKGMKFANQEMAFGFFETSAKTGTNVYAAFQTLAFHITDICNPKLMKSYHPYLIRPASTCSQIVPVSTTKVKGKHKNKKKKKKEKEKASKDDGAAVSIDTSTLRVIFTKDKNDSDIDDSSSSATDTTIDNDKKRKRRKKLKMKCAFMWSCQCFGARKLNKT